MRRSCACLGLLSDAWSDSKGDATLKRYRVAFVDAPQLAEHQVMLRRQSTQWPSSQLPYNKLFPERLGLSDLREGLLIFGKRAEARVQLVRRAKE
jgi:hypothetical protein